MQRRKMAFWAEFFLKGDDLYWLDYACEFSNLLIKKIEMSA